MAKQILVLEEVIAILRSCSAPNRVIDQFRERAELIVSKRNEKTRDEVTVSSGFGHDSRRGSVQLTVNDVQTQMDAPKAREIGVMLLEAAEAAMSDEMMMTLLMQKVGLDEERAMHVLLDLREIRQGTRGIRRQVS